MALSLTSSAFDDGDPIPEKYGYQAQNVNPPLEIEGVPPSAQSLVLIMDDPDAVEPAGKIWDHWVVWNISPSMRQLPEDWEPDTPVEGPNDYGEQGYGGPNPPDREHTYRFQLYALDRSLDIARETTADTLRDTIEDDILGETTLHGTYAP